MKTVLLSLKLFLEKPFSNAIMAIQLAIVTLVAIVASNMYQYSLNNIRILQGSSSRILYCSNPVPSFSDDDDDEFLKTMQQAKKMFPYIEGNSDFRQTVIVYNKQKLENLEPSTGDGAADVYTIDNQTIRSMQLPVSSGTWLGTNKINGKIPCVLGGIYASHYKLGQVISGYTFGKSKDSIIKLPDFVVTGVLAAPQQIPATGSSSSSSLKTSDLFQDMTNQEMFMLVPWDLIDDNENILALKNKGGAFLYLNKTATAEQIQKVREYFNFGYTQLDSEMIKEEEKDNMQTLSVLLPFLLMLLLIIFAGLISTCMLTTIKNVQTFKIYYLTGCPEIKITKIMFLYTLYYFVTAGLLFFILLKLLQSMAKPLRLMKADLLVQSNSIFSILLICLAVLICSLSIPHFILKKNNLVQLLRKD